MPLAICECILDYLSAQGQLEGVSLDPYPGGLSFILCIDCEKQTGIQGRWIQSGSSASLIEKLPDACRTLNSHVTLIGGETVKIQRSIECYSGHVAYAAEVSGVDVCLLQDWLSPTAQTTRLRPDASVSKSPDESFELSKRKKNWRRSLLRFMRLLRGRMLKSPGTDS